MKNYDEILSEVMKIKSFKEKISKLNINEKDIKKHLSTSDLLNIISTKDNIDYTTEIYLDSNKKLSWKFTYSNKNKAGQNTSTAFNNYVYKNFSDKMLEMDLSNIKKSKERVPLMNEFTRISKELKNGNSPKGIYIAGSPGVGKSFMSIMILNKISRSGKKVAQIYMPDFVAYCKSTFNKESTKSTYSIIKTMKNVDVLLIDDLGSETIAEWTINDILLPIMNYRAESELVTIITSEFTPDEFIGHYKKNGRIMEVQAKRLVERIKMNTKLIKLEGKNYRY